MEENRERIRNIMLGLFGLLISFLVFRFIIEIFDIGQTSSFIKFIVNTSDIFLNPFLGAITQEDFLSSIEFEILLSIGTYILLSIVITELLTSFFFSTSKEVVASIIDSLFKFIEFILVLKIVFDLFLVNKNIPIVKFVESFSKDIKFDVGLNELFGERIDFSIILVLVFVAVLDFFSDTIVENIFNLFSKKEKSN